VQQLKKRKRHVFWIFRKKRKKRTHTFKRSTTQINNYIMIAFGNDLGHAWELQKWELVNY